MNIILKTGVLYAIHCTIVSKIAYVVKSTCRIERTYVLYVCTHVSIVSQIVIIKIERELYRTFRDEKFKLIDMASWKQSAWYELREHKMLNVVNIFSSSSFPLLLSLST